MYERNQLFYSFISPCRAPQSLYQEKVWLNSYTVCFVKKIHKYTSSPREAVAKGLHEAHSDRQHASARRSTADHHQHLFWINLSSKLPLRRLIFHRTTSSLNDISQLQQISTNLTPPMPIVSVVRWCAAMSSAARQIEHFLSKKETTSLKCCISFQRPRIASHSSEKLVLGT